MAVLKFTCYRQPFYRTHPHTLAHTFTPDMFHHPGRGDQDHQQESECHWARYGIWDYPVCTYQLAWDPKSLSLRVGGPCTFKKIDDLLTVNSPEFDGRSSHTCLPSQVLIWERVAIPPPPPPRVLKSLVHVSNQLQRAFWGSWSNQ